jgi:predicted metal-dependent phosphoesterase TrpH
MKRLHYIAITDHNQIDFALEMQQKLGDKIIIGEEIMSEEGEVIGLFLEKKVIPGQSLERTIYDIHKQGGLAYIPHPFETVRKGLQYETIISQIKEIDIIEVFNARGFGRGKERAAYTLADRYKKPSAASSDAHSFKGLGTAFSIVSAPVTKDNLYDLLLNAEYQKNFALFLAYLAPMYNRMRKRLKL